MKKEITYFSLILLHFLIGVVIYFNEFLAKPYFWAALFFFLFRIIMAPNQMKTIEILRACAYFVGAELLLRMTKGSVSYEATKYLIVVFCLMGIVYKGLSGKAYPYFMYLMFLVPSIFVASTTLSFDANFRTNIAFVLSGPVCLGVAALFCYDKKITLEQVGEILLYILLPIVSLTAYIYFYNPSIKDVLSNTASNRAASGGFGPNQVSTVLGLGVFIVAVRYFIKSHSLNLKLFNLFLLILISYRAIVTFSRGGVLTALLSISAFLLVYFWMANKRKKNEVVLMFAFFCFGLATTWILSSTTTDGYIDLRYENKDHLGREKEDLTTGRGELFMKEIEGFLHNPFLGIGSSRAKDERIEIEGQGVTSHSEVSRTLAEHGLLGVIILLILLIKPLDFRAQNRRNYYFYAFLCFWFVTINHSSMRLAAPAFIYALALLNVTYENHPLYRQQLKA